MEKSKKKKGGIQLGFVFEGESETDHAIECSEAHKGKTEMDSLNREREKPVGGASRETENTPRVQKRRVSPPKRRGRKKGFGRTGRCFVRGGGAIVRSACSKGRRKKDPPTGLGEIKRQEKKGGSQVEEPSLKQRYNSRCCLPHLKFEGAGRMEIHVGKVPVNLQSRKKMNSRKPRMAEGEDRAHAGFPGRRKKTKTQGGGANKLGGMEGERKKT